MRRVAIVGAGVAGLVTAYALRRDGAKQGIPLEVTVLESAPRAGGRIRTTHDGGWMVEWAANAIQSTGGAAGTGVVAWRLAEELGIAQQRVIARPDAARRYIARGGRLHRIPTDPLTFLQFGALSPRSRLRVALEPIYARRVSRDETVHAYAARHLGEEAAVALIGSVVRGVFAGDAHRLSLESAFPIMREMERKHRSLVFAMMAAGSNGKSGTKGGAGAQGAGPPKTEGLGRRVLWSFRDGMASFIDALTKPLGDSLRLRTPVLSLSRHEMEERDEGGYILRCATGDTLDADAVVIAASPKTAASLLMPLDSDVGRDLHSIPSTGLCVVGLGFRADTFRRAPDGYGFLVAPDEALEVLGVLFESNLFPGRAPDGHVLVRAMIGGADRPDLMTRRDDELVALAMKALDKMVGLKSGPERTWVVRQPEAIPQYQVGHRAMIGGIAKRLDAFPRLHLVGNGYRGVSVGNLVDDAERTAARILRSF